MPTDTQPVARPVARPPGFWRRQLAAEVTARQAVFDLVAGFLLPVLCVALDTIVFGDSFLFGVRGSVFDNYTLFARGFIVIELILLLAWGLWRHRLGPLTPFVSGALATGAVFALGVGLFLLPMSLIGIFFAGIGLLGLVPFLTAFVFARNATRAYRSARASCGTLLLVAGMAIGAVLAAGAPAASVSHARAIVERAIEDVRGGADPDAATRELRLLARLARAELEPILDAYAQAGSDPARPRLARLYEGLTGRDPENVLAEMDD